MSDKAEPQEKTNGSPYQRFERFLRRLVAVPKSEIDEQEAKYKAEKRAEPKARSA